MKSLKTKAINYSTPFAAMFVLFSLQRGVSAWLEGNSLSSLASAFLSYLLWWVASINWHSQSWVYRKEARKVFGRITPKEDTP